MKTNTNTTPVWLITGCSTGFGRSLAACYLFAAIGKDTEKEIEFLRHDALLCDGFGFDAGFGESDPIFRRPAVRFPNQLKFHPLDHKTGQEEETESRGWTRLFQPRG